MKTIRFTSLSGVMAAVAILGGCAAVGNRNPVDVVSNPAKLEYRDVDARRPDFKEPFLRDGSISQAQRFPEVPAGLPPTQVKNLLGQPLLVSQGPQGTEWDYNFKFKLPQSENFLVCQYKVVFDDTKEIVRRTSWRRQQCLDLVKTT